MDQPGTQRSDANVAHEEGPVEWPLPNYASVLTPAPASGREPGVIVLNDGKELAGEVVRFDKAAARLELRPPGMQTTVTVPFQSFRSLRLARPVALGRLPIGVPRKDLEAMPRQARLRCTIRFKDGSEMSSGVIAIVARAVGLFPFLEDEEGRVVRWFLPAHATAGCRIGDPLGKILAERGLAGADEIEAGLEKQRQLRTSRLGEYLRRRNVVTAEQLDACLKVQKAEGQMALGDLLVRRGIISVAQRDQALAEQAADRNMPLGEVLVQQGLVERRAIWRALVEQLGIPWVNLRDFQFDPAATAVVPAALARRHHVVPLSRTGARLVLALDKPTAWEAIEELEALARLKIDPVLATPEDIAHALDRAYGPA